MPVNILHIVNTGDFLIGSKKLVGLNASLSIGGLQFLVHRSSLGAGTGEIILQQEVLAAVALFRKDLHTLPAGFLVQGTGNANGNAHNTDHKKGDGRDDPQLLILFGNLDAVNGSGFSHSFTLF